MCVCVPSVVQQMCALVQQQGGPVLSLLQHLSSNRPIEPIGTEHMVIDTVKQESVESPVSTIPSPILSESVSLADKYDFLEECSPVSCGDPMLMSAPVSPDIDDDL